mmetsp:Transcript_8321/g.10941  ORF Transcript_8321/g.10941 Transcript_8321/m.10941 type:complete len:448 (+) Transcript_8321:180-1523(+)
MIMDDWVQQFHSLCVGNEIFIVHQRYVDLKPIGAGANGYVCSATDKISGQQVAIKRIANVMRDITEAKRVLREIKLLKTFRDHPNIITLLDLFTVPLNTTDFTDVYIVTNLMESDLERIISSSQRLRDQHFKYFLYQILKGLKFIHSANVLHRDIKTSNLLVNANCDLVICDLGLARGMETNEDQEGLTEYVVTRWYRAPELLLNCGSYGKAVDIWSVGCVLAELACRRPFFPGKNPLQQLKMILTALGVPPEEDLSFLDAPTRAEILRFKAARPPPEPLSTYMPPDIDPLCLDLISKMLVFNPEHRISVKEALMHPYLEAFQGMFDETECSEQFDFSFDRVGTQASTSEERHAARTELKLLLYREVLEFYSSTSTNPPGTTYHSLANTPRESEAEEEEDDEDGNDMDDEFFDANEVEISSPGPSEKLQADMFVDNCSPPDYCPKQC